MIWVTRLNGSEIVINADLIETVESTPDTVVTLVDGKKYVVHEHASELVQRIKAYRASVLRFVETGPVADEPSEHHLYVLPRTEEEH